MGIIQVSKKTVLKILRVNGFVPPKLRFAPPSWRSVLDSIDRHWAMDFTTVFDRNDLQIFIFSILEVPLRQLILINATNKPTKQWLMQQLRNCSILGYCFPATMVHDRDGIYGNWLPNILESMIVYHLRRYPDRLGVILTKSVSTVPSRMNS